MFWATPFTEGAFQSSIVHGVCLALKIQTVQTVFSTRWQFTHRLIYFTDENSRNQMKRIPDDVKCVNGRRRVYISNGRSGLQLYKLDGYIRT